MAETELVTDDIAKGEKLVQALAEDRVDFRAAFWLSAPDAPEYRLTVALPVVDHQGSEAGYRVVQRAIRKHGLDIPLRRVTVLGSADVLPRAVHRVVGTVGDFGPESIRVRLGRQVIDGLLINDLYVYYST